MSHLFLLKFCENLGPLLPVLIFYRRTIKFKLCQVVQIKILDGLVGRIQPMDSPSVTACCLEIGLVLFIDSVGHSGESIPHFFRTVR